MLLKPNGLTYSIFSKVCVEGSIVCKPIIRYLLRIESNASSFIKLSFSTFFHFNMFPKSFQVEKYRFILIKLDFDSKKSSYFDRFPELSIEKLADRTLLLVNISLKRMKNEPIFNKTNQIRNFESYCFE